MFSSILVPLDGSPLAEQILPPVAQFARGLRAPVTLLTVIPAGATAAGRTPEHRATIDRIASAEAEKAREYLATQSAQLEAQRVEAHTEVEVGGHVAEGIAEHAQKHAFGLIAMSTHGRTGLTRWVMGSVADRVLHQSTVPLLLLRPREGGGSEAFQYVLLPLDQSPLAEAALPYAEALACQLDLPLTLVHVQVPLQMYFDELGGGYYPDSYELEQDVKAASAYLDTRAKALHKRGARVEASLRYGPAAFQIIEAAKENADSLIVMSTHGRTGIGRTLLGSVAGAVVREAGHPVLVVRATEPANTPA